MIKDGMTKILILVLLTSTFSSCKIAHSLIELNKKKAKVYSFKFENKDIKYIPLHHIGKNEFYENLKSKVVDFKTAGYIVFFEQISTEFTTDSLLKDTIRRKVRKIKGFSGTYKEATEDTYFKKYVQQPSYQDLGVDSNDIRADVDYLQFINEWEKVNGVIILDSVDFNTSFNEKFNKGVFYTNKQYKRIVIDFRNDFLINKIKANDNKKILILYGEGHRKNFKKKLKNQRSENKTLSLMPKNN
ncbi:MAG: hypothetical protein WHW07_10625 [Bacteroidales bacterium]